jgi:hypothetical protein
VSSRSAPVEMRSMRASVNSSIFFQIPLRVNRQLVKLRTPSVDSVQPGALVYRFAFETRPRRSAALFVACLRGDTQYTRGSRPVHPTRLAWLRTRPVTHLTDSSGA